MNTANHADDKEKKVNTNAGEDQHPSYDEGSKSDPQMTELEGLKEGGREPHVHKEDKPRDGEGKKN